MHFLCVMKKTFFIVLTLIHAIAFSQKHAHRIRYYVNGNQLVPRLSELTIIAGNDTLPKLEGTERFFVPEVDQPFKLLLKIESNVFEAGPFEPDVLERGSRVTLYYISDFRYLMKSGNFHYEKVRQAYLSSPRQKEIEKILILVIEQDALKNKGKRHKEATIGRFKFFYRK